MVAGVVVVLGRAVVVEVEVVAVVWVVAVVLVVVVLVVDVAAAQMAAKRFAVGMFVVTDGAGAGEELGELSVSMIAFVKGEDVDFLCALLFAFLGIICVLVIGKGVGVVLTTLFKISGVELLISVAAFSFSI